MLAMHVFFIMTGLLAARTLSPPLTASRASSSQVRGMEVVRMSPKPLDLFCHRMAADNGMLLHVQVITGYWAKRVWRILPAYYVALLINSAVKVWPSAWSNTSEEAARVRDYFDLAHDIGQEGSRWCKSQLVMQCTADRLSIPLV